MKVEKKLDAGPIIKQTKLKSKTRMMLVQFIKNYLKR